MKLTIGTTYKVVAAPTDGYKCASITITGLEKQPKTTVDPTTGEGTCTFEMSDEVEAIDATFERIPEPEPTTKEVTVGGQEGEIGKPVNVDNGTITVSATNE